MSSDGSALAIVAFADNDPIDRKALALGRFGLSRAEAALVLEINKEAGPKQH